MAATIKILPKQIRERIRAGEVIERPSSCVKELIENSLDAKAICINIEIENGGRSLIRVIDDGLGMSKEDTLLCCERYSTNKISTIDDLSYIKTLGFRGEALASIASISQLKIITRPKNQDFSYLVEYEGGQKIRDSISSSNFGTIVEVRNLFFNTPARRKFLKSISWETSQIIKIVTRFSISHPEVNFKLTHNKREILSTYGSNNLKDRINLLFGKDLGSQLIEVESENSLFRIYGFLAKPIYTRLDRKYQMFFVNRRYIQNDLLTHALIESYHTLLPKGRNPVSFIFMHIEPDKIDVNIHPAKLKVKFYNSKQIHDLLVKILRKKLESFSSSQTVREIFYQKQNEKFVKEENYSYSELSKNLHQFSSPNMPQVKEKIIDEIEELKPRLNIIQIKRSFILTFNEEGILIIDQHAAHERVLYEKFMKHLENKKVESQSLLFPVTLNLSYTETENFKKISNVFYALGFDIEEFGKNTFIVQKVPPFLKNLSPQQLILDVLDELKDMKSKKAVNFKEKVIILLSCHAAIKAGEKLSEAEMHNLIDELDRTKLKLTCPHGRPTTIRLTWQELEKKFKRR